jgi:ADP-ribosyl-[dinitrogen reductase] hydrolase
MTSTHKRNVSGMHRAKRCEARTRDGAPCQAPAVAGKKRCHNHGGKGSKGKSYRRERTDSRRAYLHWDQLVQSERKQLGKVIRKLERSGDAPHLLPDFMSVYRGLNEITKRKQDDLAAGYALSEAERVTEREKAAALAAAHLYSPSRSESIELVRDRARGAMVGLAVGEAIGMTTDGWKRDSYREVSDMVGGGFSGVRAGEWGGDTAMALALMESLTFRRAFDPTDVMDRFTEMLEEGVYSCSGICIGVGETTKEAIARYAQTDDPIAGNALPDNVDTGALVRIAPVAVRYWEDRTKRRDVAELQCRTTHGSQVAVDACVAFANILGDAISGLPRSEILRPRQGSEDSAIWSIMAGMWTTKNRHEIGSRNSVLHALEAALWCVHKTESFDDAVLMAANLGEDAGTVAAVTGQLAGAMHGECAIPGRWLEQLAWRHKLIDMTDALFEQSSARY